MPEVIVRIVSQVRNTAIPVHVRKPATRTYTMLTLKHSRGEYVACGGGVSMAGDVWLSVRPVLDIGGVWKAGRHSYTVWESEIEYSWRVPVSAVLQ